MRWQEAVADDSDGPDPKPAFEGLERKYSSATMFAALDAAKLPEEFMSEADRNRRPPDDRSALDQLFEEDSPKR